MTFVVFLMVATAILIGITGYLFYVYSVRPTTSNLVFSLVFLVGTLVFVFMERPLFVGFSGRCLTPIFN